jgi:putative secretion ATPase (PEP-CTERM system associated)
MYNSYFGFSVSPFSVTPDPSFFYSNPVYQEAYAILQYGIEAKKGFIVITGEVGTGKTTLLRKLLRDNLQATIHTVFIFNTYLDFTELLQVIHQDLGLGTKETNKVKLLQKLNEYLITQLKQSHIVAVLVDEAQNLSDDALEGLRLLSNLETDEEKLIQIVLMGQPELQAKLDRPTLRQLKQRVALQCRLLPLHDEEVGRYIDFRLRAAGYTSNDLFHPDAVRQITIYSSGIPRVVNMICDNALLSAYASAQKNVSTKVIKEVARDLRLGLEQQSTQTEIVTVTKAEPATIHDAAKEIPQHNRGRFLNFAVQSLAVILGLVALGSFISPKNFITTIYRSFEIAKGNLHEWVLLVRDQEPLPQQANAKVNIQDNSEVKIEPKEQRVIIPRGSTIYKIAVETYGANTALGMDMIQESNPEIKNLNRVSVGQAVLLPSLTPETLRRKQSGGSYHLIAATFYRRVRADEYASRLRNEGYQVTITPRKVSDDLLLHRVEIEQLRDVGEAHQAWLAGQETRGLYSPVIRNENRSSELLEQKSHSSDATKNLELN